MLPSVTAEDQATSRRRSPPQARPATLWRAHQQCLPARCSRKSPLSSCGDDDSHAAILTIPEPVSFFLSLRPLSSPAHRYLCSSLPARLIFFLTSASRTMVSYCSQVAFNSSERICSR